MPLPEKPPALAGGVVTNKHKPEAVVFVGLAVHNPTKRPVWLFFAENRRGRRRARALEPLGNGKKGWIESDERRPDFQVDMPVFFRKEKRT